MVANLSIVSIDPETNEPIKTEEIYQKETVKFLLINENEEIPKLCQVNYAGGVMGNSTLINYEQKRFKKLSDLFSNNENVDGELFYSLMSMLLNNNGKLLIDYLKKTNSKIRSNVELVNRDKLNLLKNYKSYLIAAKEEDAADLENPLKPKAEDKRLRVNEIKASSFLKADPIIKQVKVEDDFFWEVDADNVTARFDSSHRMKELTVKTSLGQIELVLGRFVLFGSQMEFPEFIWFKDLAGRKYEIKATKVSMFQDNSDNHRKRVKRYSKASEENKLTKPEIRPSFLL